MTTTIINGHVVASHVVEVVELDYKGKKVTTGPDIVDCWLLLAGPFKSLHFQLHPN